MPYTDDMFGVPEPSDVARQRADDIARYGLDAVLEAELAQQQEDHIDATLCPCGARYHWCTEHGTKLCARCGDKCEQCRGMLTMVSDTPPQSAQGLKERLLGRAGLDALQPPRWAVDGIMPTDSIVWTQGRRGEMKTFVALDMAASISTGTPWHGRPVTQGPALYVAAEGVSGIRKRVHAWEQAHDLPLLDIHWLPVAVQVADRYQWRELVELARELEPSYIGLDTQSRISTGMEENSAKDMGELVQRLEELREATGACVNVVHHRGRNGDHMRGSTAMEGAATTIIDVSKEAMQVTVTCTKQKDHAEFAPVYLRAQETLESLTLIETNPDAATRSTVTDAVRIMARAWWEAHGDEPVSRSTLLSDGVTREGNLSRYIKALEREGYVTLRGTESRRLYRLVRVPDQSDLNSDHFSPLQGGESD